MNPLPPNADELVSAYLDGQAAPDEVAIVEANPELMERVEALRSVSDLLRAPIEPPAEQKEAHIAAALGAFDAMFSADSTDETPEESSPPLAAVPPVAAEAAQREQQPAAVTSLDTARERRRPRRFNTGVIAAAAAAMLLFVAIAAFGFGGGDSADVATTAASDTADFATDSGDDAMEAAMADDEDAMDDNEGSALSALPAPTAAAPETARAEASEAMDEEAMDEEAMDDAAADEAPMADQEPAADIEESEPVEADNADADGATDAEVAGGAGPLLFADFAFPDLDSLLRELEALPADELQARALLLEPGLFPSCQADIADLAAVETPTLVGQAFVADEPVEIHQILGDNDEILFVLVDANCMILQAPNS